MNKISSGTLMFVVSVAFVAFVFASQAHAYGLYKSGRTELNADLNAVFGFFHSQESYAQFRTSSGSQSWQEGFVKYGLSGSYAFKSGNQVYGAARLISTASWDDGDAAGFTTGSEGRTNFEDAYVGWKSGKVFPAFGKDGIDISAGRQKYTIGNGFLIYGDALNFGKGFDQTAPQSLNRGGAYYLAARESFDRTAILRLGQSENLRGEVFWLDSGNKGQAKTELAGLNAEYEKSHYGTLGLTYLKGLSVNERLAEFLGYTQRDGQDTFSVRANGSAGVELWKPDIGARYSSFSSGFDPLFYGSSTGYGTWYQGEVAGNYAGPFNSNAEISHLYLNAQPLPSLTLGILFFDFRTKNHRFGKLDATEWDIYAEWEINKYFSASPLIGFYTPSKSAGQGGVQLGNDDTNTYAQMIVTVSY
jgi:hypothetical protein